ncbi:MAG: beta-lactamase-like protein 2 [SAR324 cluster bacterium]|nr:beta-lactamase-like protein 2 [SAR324 cluster bacterium]
MPDLLPGAENFPRTAVLSEQVHRVLGLNPSAFTGPGTNTYLLGAPGGTPLLMDTGVGLPEYLDLLKAHLASEGFRPLTRILLTHVHGDHIGGVADVLGEFPGIPVHKFPWPERDRAYDLSLEPIVDGQLFTGEGYTLRAVHTPGHAQDHICYYLEEERALFTGDVILGVGTTVIPQDGGNLTHYLDTLRKLQTLDLARIYPGHGPVIDTPREKIAEYLAHRLQREQQILSELSGGRHTVEEMVRSIYREYPERLYAAAGQSVLSHLDKLESEGRVAREHGDPPRFTLLD